MATNSAIAVVIINIAQKEAHTKCTTKESMHSVNRVYVCVCDGMEKGEKWNVEHELLHQKNGALHCTKTPLC